MLGIVLAGVTAAHASGAPLDPLAVLTSSSQVSSCQESGVSVEYDVAYSAELGGYAVVATHLDGLATGCDGQSATVVLSGIDGRPLAELTSRIDGGGARLTMPVPDHSPVPAADLTSVAVTVSA